MDLCQTDKSYNTMIFGLIHIKEDSAKAKVQRDIRETAVELPANLGMEAELESSQELPERSTGSIIPTKETFRRPERFRFRLSEYSGSLLLPCIR